MSKPLVFKNKSKHLPDFCQPTGEVLALIGDKWSLPILGELKMSSKRYSELLAAIPAMPHRMLTLKLRSFERDGLVARSVEAGVPPKVDYALTARGLGLINALASLSAWAQDNFEDIMRSREAFDVRDGEAQSVASRK